MRASRMKRESEKPGPTEALGSLSSKPQAGLHHCGLLGVAMSYRTVGCIALFLYAIAATSIYWFLLKVPADQAREDSCFIPDLIRNVLDLTCLPGDSQQKQRLGAGRALNISRRECSVGTHSNNAIVYLYGDTEASSSASVVSLLETIGLESSQARHFTGSEPNVVAVNIVNSASLPSTPSPPPLANNNSSSSASHRLTTSTRSKSFQKFSASTKKGSSSLGLSRCSLVALIGRCRLVVLSGHVLSRDPRIASQAASFFLFPEEKGAVVDASSHTTHFKPSTGSSLSRSDWGDATDLRKALLLALDFVS